MHRAAEWAATLQNLGNRSVKTTSSVIGLANPPTLKRSPVEIVQEEPYVSVMGIL